MKRKRKKTYYRPKRCHMTPLEHFPRHRVIPHVRPHVPPVDQTYVLHSSDSTTSSTCCRCHELHVYMYLYAFATQSSQCIFFFSLSSLFLSHPAMATNDALRCLGAGFFSFFCLFLLTNIYVHIGLSTTTSGEGCHHHNATSQWKGRINGLKP